MTLLVIELALHVRGPLARTLALRSEYFMLLVPIGKIVTNIHLIARAAL